MHQIYNLMSKVSTIKTMTIKQIYIPRSELSSLWCIPSEFLPLLIIIFSFVEPFTMVESSLLHECGRSCCICISIYTHYYLICVDHDSFL
jgi:hypothetical protein